MECAQWKRTLAREWLIFLCVPVGTAVLVFLVVLVCNAGNLHDSLSAATEPEGKEVLVGTPLVAYLLFQVVRSVAWAVRTLRGMR